MLLDFLLPNKLIGKFESEINGEVEVRSEFGQLRVVVKGIPQSGGIVQDILRKCLDEFNNPKQFLLLGLGGGAILREVRRRWPECSLTVVEIDPVMIDISKRHFGVDKINNLEMVNQNALYYVKGRHAMKYDAVLADCYVGEEVPEELESEQFLTDLSQLLAPEGVVVFNRIVTGRKRYATVDFGRRLAQIFKKVELSKNYCNMKLVANSY